jgi:hypothetical protein
MMPRVFRQGLAVRAGQQARFALADPDLLWHRYHLSVLADLALVDRSQQRPRRARLLE